MATFVLLTISVCADLLSSAKMTPGTADNNMADKAMDRKPVRDIPLICFLLVWVKFRT